MTLFRPVLPCLILGLALAGCTDPYGNPNRPANGALIGGATGAVLGGAVGHGTRGALIGGALGAAVGGAIGTDLARQEAELNAGLGGSGIRVVNTGSALQMTLPEDVTFATGSSAVNTGFRPALQSLADSLTRYPNSTVVVAGHTDTVGGAAYNRQLSQDRALAVAQILVAYGVSAGRITAAGYGYDQPIASNGSAAGRAQNRRVEIVITPTR
ncbi:OmpA family protein [Rhodobacter sp. KR11]|jgi:outer membrane protein OmpA-like peptidoglycan-associated protein|uniref:OmpA family protein n=1 Tax=Rhodobacter sp. KR11 TaxID=2974588 RepID=UPI00222214BA|nr:OmpA family protein [Rhodobacter sp. KR11]MCW1917516.1 OmpA family protein [Rhodobacter sp. KR11]